jgi:hypothetical protein
MSEQQRTEGQVMEAREVIQTFATEEEAMGFIFGVRYMNSVNPDFQVEIGNNSEIHFNEDLWRYQVFLIVPNIDNYFVDLF